MNIAGVTTGAHEAMTATGNQSKDIAAVTVMRQSMDMQKQMAAQLIDAVPQPQKAASANPNLGSNVDLFA